MAETPAAPRCSVVIPTFNRKESLRRTLDALARQSLSADAFEVIVVSDGSADGTEQLLSDYAENGSLRLRWFSQPNRGPAAARNLGIEKAEAQIIVFTDDDVEPVPEFLARHLRRHDREERLVVIGPLSPNPKWVGVEPVWIAWEHQKLQEIYAMFKPGGKYEGCFGGYEHFYSGNASVRRKWLIEVGCFNTQFTRQEDVELASRLWNRLQTAFLFDFEADALHHPLRTLKSWLAVPSAYGKLDAERVASGALSQDWVAANTRTRHAATRRLTDACLAAPSLLAPATALLCAIAVALYAAGLRRPAFASLSALYNTLYAAAYESATRAQPERRQVAHS